MVAKDGMDVRVALAMDLLQDCLMHSCEDNKEIREKQYEHVCHGYLYYDTRLPQNGHG